MLHNIMKYGVRQARLWSCYVQAAAVLNGLYAPRNSNVNKNQVEDMAAACTHKLQQDCPTVLQFFSIVLMDKRLHNSADKNAKGKTGRTKFVKTLDVALNGKLQNKVSTSTFFGVQRAYMDDGADEMIHSKAVVLVELAIEQKWVTTYEDLVTPVQKLKPLQDRHKEHVTVRAAAKDAKIAEEYLKAKTKHILHQVTSLTLCPNQVNGTQIINLGTRAHFKKFGSLYKHFGSPDECQDFSVSMANFGWLEMLEDGWRCLQDTAELERSGFTLCFRASTIKASEALKKRLAYDQMLATTLGS